MVEHMGSLHCVHEIHGREMMSSECGGHVAGRFGGKLWNTGTY